MNKVKLLLLLSTLIASTGCSTMFNGGTQNIRAYSSDEQEGIEVMVDSGSGMYKTKLPANISTVASSEEVTIRVVDDCYEHSMTNVDKSITASYWANILNFWGFFIDVGTGKMWNYNDTVYVYGDMKEECKVLAKGEDK
jgi:hypothetical protein